MTIPASGAVSFSDIRSEFNDTGPISFSDLYRGGSLVLDNYTNTSVVPTTGAIDLADFRGVKLEGTAQEKVALFQQYRHSNLSYRGVDGGTASALTSDYFGINSPVARYTTSFTLPVPAVDRSTQKGESQWTSLIGGIAAVGAGVSTSSINLGSYYDDDDTSADNEAIVINHVNTVHRDISAGFNFASTMVSQNKAIAPTLFIVPGKWGIASTTTSQSFTLGAGQMALAAYERGGDGPVGGGWSASASPSSGFTSTRFVSWWYNNTGIQVMANSSSVSQTVTISDSLAEDIVFILEELL